MTKINFNDLDNVEVAKISCIDIFDSLVELRENPEEFEKAADALRSAAIMQFGRGRNPEEMEGILRKVDAEVKKAPDQVTGAATALVASIRSAVSCLEKTREACEIINRRDNLITKATEEALEELPFATKS